MQISRHWRMNSQRYRLQGVRYENGEIRLVARNLPCADTQREGANKPQERARVAVGR